MDLIFCNPNYAQILESIFFQLDFEDLKNCRKVNANFRNILDQPFLWLKINQARGSFEYGQNINSWETLVKLTSRTVLGKNVAKILMNLNEIGESFKLYHPHCIKILYTFTPLHMMAHQGSYFELMKFMVDNIQEFGYESLDQVLDECNYHPLHDIMKNNGNIEMIKFLIQNMKNVNLKTTDEMCTPLHFAAMNGNLEAVKLLLANGGDPEAKDYKDVTPIIFAEIYGHEEILDCFFKFLGKVNQPIMRAISKPSFTHAM